MDKKELHPTQMPLNRQSVSTLHEGRFKSKEKKK